MNLQNNNKILHMTMEETCIRRSATANQRQTTHMNEYREQQQNHKTADAN